MQIQGEKNFDVKKGSHLCLATTCTGSQGKVTDDNVYRGYIIMMWSEQQAINTQWSNTL